MRGFLHDRLICTQYYSSLHSHTDVGHRVSSLNISFLMLNWDSNSSPSQDTFLLSHFKAYDTQTPRTQSHHSSSPHGQGHFCHYKNKPMA